jgi:hypothetical protein
MKNQFFFMVLVVVLPLVMLSNPTASKTPPTANDILISSRDRNDGVSYTSDVILRLIGKNEAVRDRHFYMLQKDIGESEERALMHFHKPADVRGVSFLIINHGENKNKADDQWMFLPAFRKTRRIGSNDKRGSFMGAEFNYSDLDKIRVFDYSNTLLGEDEVLGEAAWLIERIPVDQQVINKTGYHKVQMWISKQKEVILQQHYYNAKGVVFKTQHSTETEKVQNIWTIMKSHVENIENQKSSKMIFTDIVYNVAVEDKHVSKRTLKESMKASDIPK